MDKRYQGVIRRRKSMKDYPLVSFVHCFVCPSLIYAFLLPLGIFNPLICLSFSDLRLLITPWYLLSIVRTDKTMDKRYQGVIRRRKSQKDRQINGLKIPRGNKKAYINDGQKKQCTQDTKGSPSYYPLVSLIH
jgi:hypothetical protein